MTRDIIVIAVVKVKNQPYPILLRKSLHMMKPKMAVVPVAVKIKAYTLDPIFDPNKLTAAVGNIEKCPPKQKNDNHTDIKYKYELLAVKYIVDETPICITNIDR
jgi:hypothetical protein